MALETGSLVSDLVATNPTSGDPVSQADDHLRLIKSVLQGQFPDASSGAIYGLRSGTATASTSGTSVDFTSIPSWVSRVTVMFNGVSTNGTSNILVQVGDSGGVESSGYFSAGGVVASPSTPAFVSATTGFIAAATTTGSLLSGAITLTRLSASTNTWVSSGVVVRDDSVDTITSSAGTKSLSATLDRVRITTANGTDTFDAGTVNILYE